MADKLTKDETELVSPDGTEIFRVSVSPFNTGATNRKITFNNFLSWIASGIGLGNYLRKSGADTGATGAPQEFTEGIEVSTADYDEGLETGSQVKITNEYVSVKSYDTDTWLLLNTQNGIITAQNIDGTTYGTIAKDGKINGVKCYRALLSQTGTDTPTATVLENTLGVTPTYDRVDPGKYNLQTSIAVFTANKTFITMDFSHANDTSEAVTFIRHKLGDTQTVTIVTNSLDLGGAATPAADGVLDNTEIQILVYP